VKCRPRFFAFEDRPDLIGAFAPYRASTGMLSTGPPTTYIPGEVSVKRANRRGPGPSHLLTTPDHAGNVVGVEPA
jgi:hypothetical protein